MGGTSGRALGIDLAAKASEGVMLYFVFDYSTTPSKEEQGWVGPGPVPQRGSEASEAVLSGEKRMICVCDLQSVPGHRVVDPPWVQEDPVLGVRCPLRQMD